MKSGAPMSSSRVKKTNGAGGLPAQTVESTLPIPPTKIAPQMTRTSAACRSIDGMLHNKASPSASQTPL